MNNYKLIIQYDGTRYAGWQMQENDITVQQQITESIKIILKEKVNLIGSGRTDTGVHALGQAANFQTERDLDIYRFKHSLNSILPKDISIIQMNKAEKNFNARFDAKKRSYIYLISKFKNPFCYNYSYFYNNADCKSLNLLSRSLIGIHDFTSFCKKQTETENKICNIYYAHWKETKGIILFLIEADRFLHGMIRAIVGSILLADKNKFDELYINNLFSLKNREAAGESAPAKGLFLYKVKYD